ncbi:MAG: hypothetical protein WCP28_22205, partial [Actinomycetes bacterium]
PDATAQAADPGPVLPDWLASGTWQWDAHTAVIGGTDADGAIWPQDPGIPRFNLDLACITGTELTDTERAAAGTAWIADTVLILGPDRFGAPTLIVDIPVLDAAALVEAIRRFARIAGVPADLLWTCTVQVPLAPAPDPPAPGTAR